MLFEEMEVLYPFALYKRPQFVLAKKFQRGRLLDICIGCIIAKTNIHDCDVGYYVPTCFTHFCKMLDMMFKHILLRNPRLHIFLTKQCAYLFRISCGFIPKGVTIL
jgi:hypothetical protein